MITRSEIKVGMRIIEDDPEPFVDTPFKGTVKEITNYGDNPNGLYNYTALIEIDKEFMELNPFQLSFPDGIMHCFGWQISVLKEE